jgi:hypothetical protein
MKYKVLKPQTKTRYVLNIRNVPTPFRVEEFGRLKPNERHQILICINDSNDWIKHVGNKEKSRFSGRVSTSKHRKKCVSDACNIRVFVPGIRSIGLSDSAQRENVL